VGDAIEKLSEPERLLRLALFKDAVLPARIVLGFGGYNSEATLRLGFVQALGKRVNDKTLSRRLFIPPALPDLVVGPHAALVKLNGMPYPGPYAASEGMWNLFGSIGRYPMRTLLEILWTRLTYHEGVSTTIFGEDLELEKITRLLTAKYLSSPAGRGWTYEHIHVPARALPEGPETIEWAPTVVTNGAFTVLTLLCAGREVLSDDEGLAKELLESGSSAAAVALELSASRLAFLDKDGCFKLLTTACQLAIVPDLGYVAADDKNGRFSSWLARRLGRSE
jgi:hypothetical protein